MATEHTTDAKTGGETQAPRNTRQLVNAATLLVVLWEEGARPSLRWLREQQKRRTIPYVKLGHLVWFDVETVRAALFQKFSVKARGAA